MAKPSLPQGTRDFGPDVVRKRNYILNTIKNVFELYGFQPLETPAMENLDTLMGKYGEEGDKLIFKILNNGLDNPDKEKQIREDFEKVLQGKNTKGITERALKYDLTIPFARYVAMNHNQLTFPFKRYQVQPVWRADRPQRGRYREFYQCDADVVGSSSLLSDIEMICIYITALGNLGFKQFNYSLEPTGYFIKINNRKVLSGLAEICHASDKLTIITTAIDKIDKIGIDKVKEELSRNGLSHDQISIIVEFISIERSSNSRIISEAKKMLQNSSIGIEGIQELEFILEKLPFENLPKDFIEVDLSLARGLNYYTGLIVEVKMPHSFKMGSIGGGGRYDDLTGLFGVPNIPGVGISFGVDRIYDVMEELNLFPPDVHVGTQVLFFNLGEAESKKSFELMQQLRQRGIRSELYHETAKFDKQFKYAEKKNIPFVVIIGEKELNDNSCNIKNLSTGKQETILLKDLPGYQF